MQNLKNAKWTSSAVVPRFSGDAFWEVRDGKGDVICRVTEDNPNAQAIANLIAAAPELLQELRRAERFMGGFEDDESNPGINARLAHMRNLIKKAKGTE